MSVKLNAIEKGFLLFQIQSDSTPKSYPNILELKNFYLTYIPESKMGITTTLVNKKQNSEIICLHNVDQLVHKKH
ncbi:unnamed protein product [Paramecium sonneborni]|uniref:Uncharacterized protein n=1 Tax=Paramecium sonneborni TaxID=65129 RepID=A0A8S1L1J7_9CILI|nr:unnamed protein product [Paramecium sonneborni]